MKDRLERAVLKAGGNALLKRLILVVAIVQVFKLLATMSRIPNVLAVVAARGRSCAWFHATPTSYESLRAD